MSTILDKDSLRHPEEWSITVMIAARDKFYLHRMMGRITNSIPYCYATHITNSDGSAGNPFHYDPIMAAPHQVYYHDLTVAEYFQILEVVKRESVWDAYLTLCNRY